MDSDNEIKAMQQAHAALADLDETEKTRVVQWLISKFQIPLVLGGSRSGVGVGGPGLSNANHVTSGRTDLSPKDFVASKKPSTEAERVAVLAYYLTYNRDTPEFKTKELSALNGEAAQPKLKNPARTVDDATKNQYLAASGGGSKRITARGEAMVVALPDRESVKKVLEEYPLTRGAKRNRGAKKAKKKS